MYSSLLNEEIIRARRDRKTMGWTALLIGSTLLALSFAPSRINSSGSICIAGFGLVLAGLTYLVTARSDDWKMEMRRQFARIICGLCVVATIIIMVLDNAPMR